MAKYILGMDIGGTNTRLGLVDENYHLEDFTIVSTEKLIATGDTVTAFIEVVKDYIADHADKDVIGISAGFPATLDKERKTVLSAPNVKGFDNTPFVEKLTEATGIPTIIETDVDMLILYDMHALNIPKDGVTCGFYFGTGMGNAIVINGNLLIGKNGASAELGHIPIRGVVGQCGCGNTSCSELVASGYHLRDIVAESFPDTHISNVFTEKLDTPQIQQFVDDLAAVVATEINILDPEYIILGGGLTKMPDFPFALLEANIKKYARNPYPAESLSYYYAHDGQENGVIGAGILGFSKFN